MKLNELWNNILSKEGEVFNTKTGLPFTFVNVDNEKIRIYRNDKAVGYVSINNIKFILDNPNLDRHQYRDAMATSSYALALYKSINKE